MNFRTESEPGARLLSSGIKLPRNRAVCTNVAQTNPYAIIKTTSPTAGNMMRAMRCSERVIVPKPLLETYLCKRQAIPARLHFCFR